MNFKTFFHYISYLQYPLMLIGMYFAFKPYLQGIEHFQKNSDLIFQNLNSVLIFMGLGISFSSLQDTTKTQNKLSERIWKNPKKGKIMIVFIGVMILTFLTFGLIGYFISKAGILKELSIGTIILGLGMFGFLKAAIEMFENHRVDKNK
jgi:magnesium-transporting ATPase (P-type)